MPHETHAFGDLQVTVLCDVEADVPVSDVVEPGDSPEGLAELPERFPEEFGPGGFRFRAHSYLVRTPEHLVVVDTGIGDESTGMSEWVGSGGRLPTELSEAGVNPGDVDHVVMTHSHGDHVGWNTVSRDGRYEPFFQNARYWLHEADWARGREDEEVPFDLVLAPLERDGVLTLTSGDTDVAPGLRMLHTPGHTPGHSCLEVAAGVERLLFAGDLVCFSFQFGAAGVLSGLDEDEAWATRTRTEMLEEVEAEGIVLAVSHLPIPMGRIVRHYGDRAFEAV